MGFFGFLKKKNADSPTPAKTPSTSNLPPPGSAMPPPNGAPARNEGIPPPPGNAPLTPPQDALIHDQVHQDDFPIDDVDLGPLNASENFSAEEFDNQPDSEGPAPIELPFNNTGETPTRETVATAAPTKPSTPEPTPTTTPVAGAHTPPANTPPPEANAIPDFTDEEIAKAEEIEHALTPAEAAGEDVAEERVADVVHELEPLPEFAVEGNAHYILATTYKEAVHKVASAMKSTKRGEAAGARFEEKMNAHKEAFTQFADKLNTVQKELVTMDTILLEG